MALNVEILPGGLFGLLGFGQFHAGATGLGIAWLVTMLVWTRVAAVIAISSVTLSDYTKKRAELFGP